MKNRMILAAIACVFTLLSASSSQAVLVSVDDFESGPLSGWDFTATGTSTLSQVADPDDPSNTVLQFTGSGGNVEARKDVSTISDGTTGTLFYRLRITSRATQYPGTRSNIGLTDKTWAARNVSFPQNDIRTRVFTTEGSSATELRTYSSYAVTTVDSALDGNTWLNFWVVADNTTNTFDLHVQGGDYPTQTLLASGQTWHRNEGLGNDLTGFYLSARGGRIGYLDDIYVDTAGENLSNPTLAAVPEPSSFLFGLTVLGLVLRQRHRQVA